jgi:site-specific DNA-methyltransferase (adenine-specific)
MVELLKGDCLELMKGIPDGSIDAIITDPPYGTTACKWDSVIPFELMWEQLNRIIKPNGAIVLFGSEPFSSALRMSNIKNWKYDWIWCKNQPSGQFNASKMPMKSYEIISIFYREQPTYNPQMVKRTEKELKRLSHKSVKGVSTDTIYGDINRKSLNRYENKTKYPTNVIKNIKCVFNRSSEKVKHPTQKPIALMEYLIKTYTSENETVLDFTMGSGSTGVAAQNLNRKFIGIEMDDKYFEIARKRIEDNKMKLF